MTFHAPNPLIAMGVMACTAGTDRRVRDVHRGGDCAKAERGGQLEQPVVSAVGFRGDQLHRESGVRDFRGDGLVDWRVRSGDLAGEKDGCSPAGRRAAAATLEARMSGETPRPHQERGGSEVDGRLGGAVGLHVIFVKGFRVGIVGAVVPVELLEGVNAIRRAEIHTADHARRCVIVRTFRRCAPEDWHSPRCSIQRAGQVCDLVLNAIRESAAVADDEGRCPRDSLPRIFPSHWRE